MPSETFNFFLKDMLIFYNDKIWDEKEFIKAINKFSKEHSDKKILLISSNKSLSGVGSISSFKLETKIINWINIAKMIIQKKI